jgi:hypothetical protein
VCERIQSSAPPWQFAQEKSSWAWSFPEGASSAGSTFRIGAWQAVQLADSAALAISNFRAIALDCPFVKVAEALKCGSARFQI